MTLNKPIKKCIIIEYRELKIINKPLQKDLIIIKITPPYSMLIISYRIIIFLKN